MRALVCALFAALAAGGCHKSSAGAADAGGADAGRMDAGPVDAGAPDAGIAGPRERDFNTGWRFARDVVGEPGDPNAGASDPAYDDSSWRSLDLPHDFSIEDLPADLYASGPFSRDKGQVANGYSIGGTGWYRKHFAIAARDANQQIAILFDGVLVESDVWINGHPLGHQAYGYVPFAYDLTPYLHTDGTGNVLAVRAVNAGANSRWYTGSGIYREVRLVVTSPVHIDTWGVHATTLLAATSATVTIATNIVATDGARAASVVAWLVGPDGTVTMGPSTQLSFTQSGTVTQSIAVANPKLWSPGSPALYDLVVQLSSGAAVVDAVSMPIGLRSISWNAAEGFKLNGAVTKLRGAAIHHSNGILGAAAFARGEERKVELLKASGYNAIRTAHNPPSRAMLDACDRLGMMVIDEFTDVWNVAKTVDDYAKDFATEGPADLTAMIERDRNHASVVAWGIGNEVPERFTDAGIATATQLISQIRALDAERFITQTFPGAAMTGSGSSGTVVAAYRLVDVASYNYNQTAWEDDFAAYPDIVRLSGESLALHAYDVWSRVEKYPWAIGDFVWSAMDYLGEPAVGYTGLSSDPFNRIDPWPWINSGCGDLDINGEKRPQSRYRDVVWGNSPIELLVHAPIPAGVTEVLLPWSWPDERESWTWPGNEGTSLTVSAYARADSVRLELNGQAIGEQAISTVAGTAGITAAKPVAALVARFKVPYAAGMLRAIAVKNGVDIASKTLTTIGPAAKIVLTADRATLSEDRGDLAFVAVQVADAAGSLDPNSAATISLTLVGPGELIAAGNGSPNQPASAQSSNFTVVRGKGLLVIRPKSTSGDVTLTATATGLQPATIVIPVR